MNFLRDGDAAEGPLLLLAHGAGAAMDTMFMGEIATGVAASGVAVARFEFAYMAGRRTGGPKRPPPRADKLIPEFLAAIAALDHQGPLMIGGKSMGGRVASLMADALFAEGKIAGLVCLGYPFHAPGKPEQPRTEHLERLQTPALICQGTRDPFGRRDEIAGYTLSPQITTHWLEDGDHDFKPRKSVTQTTHVQNLHSAAQAIATWSAALR